MKLTWQDIDKIVHLYNMIEREDEQDGFDWSMDEDNTGIKYPYLSHEDICKEVLREYNNSINK